MTEQEERKILQFINSSSNFTFGFLHRISFLDRKLTRKLSFKTLVEINYIKKFPRFDINHHKTNHSFF